jgi:hypothetical protein
VAGPPKSDAGRRVIALDKTTIAALCEHRFRQQAERAATGARWAGTGYVFTTQSGKRVSPAFAHPHRDVLNRRSTGGSARQGALRRRRSGRSDQ